MARYYQAPKNDIVDLTPKIPIEYYANLIKESQQNRDQASTARAAFLTDAYGQKYINEKSRDYAISQAQAPLNEALDKDFVTPATMAKAVSQASQILAPWQNLNAKQLELAKAAENYKMQHGIHAMVKDPSTLQLRDERGNWVDPNSLKLTTMNEKDIYDMFGQTYGSNLLNSKESLVDSDIPYKYKLEKVKGLSKEEKMSRLSPGTRDAVELAQGMMATNPTLRNGLLDIYGSDEAAMNALQQINLRAAFEDKYNQTIDSQYIDDEWSLFLAKERAKEPPPPSKINMFDPVKQGPVVNPVKEQGLESFMFRMGNGKGVVNWKNMIFNEEGNLMTTGTETIYLYGMPVVTYPTVNKQYKEARHQLTTFRNKLKGAGILVKSDKEALDLMEKSYEGTASYYQLYGDALTDQFRGSNWNPFKDSDGNFKDSKSAELEMYDEESGKYVGVSVNELSNELGWDNSSATNSERKNLRQQLAEGSSKVLDYSGGKPKLRGSVVSADGTKTYTVRYNPDNQNVSTAAKPYAYVQQSLINPGDHQVEIGDVFVEYTVLPQMANTGEVVNRVFIKDAKARDRSDEAQNRENNSVVETLLSNKNNPQIGKFLQQTARNYRDGYLDAKQAIYRSESVKKGE